MLIKIAIDAVFFKLNRYSLGSSLDLGTKLLCNQLYNVVLLFKRLMCMKNCSFMCMQICQ